MLQSISRNCCQTASGGVARHPNAVPAIESTCVPVVVIVIRDVVDIGNARVTDVDVPEITPASAVPRKEWLTKTKRAPAKSAAETKAEANAKVRASEPRHHRRGVPGTSPIGARSPAPVAAKRDPAAIVERRESPGRGVYPGPSPRRLIDPLTVAIRRPARRDRRRNPHRSVVGRLTPSSVFIEVSSSNHAGCYVARGDRIVLTLVADFAPIVETIWRGCVADLMRQGISIAEARLLAFMHAHRGALTSRFALTFPYRYESRVSVGIDIEAIFAGLSYRERLIRRIDLVDFAAIKLADMHIQCALVQLDLHGIIGNVGQSQTGFRTDSHHTGAETQFGARIFISPNVVADGQRTVERALHPIASALGLKRN